MNTDFYFQIHVYSNKYQCKPIHNNKKTTTQDVFLAANLVLMSMSFSQYDCVIYVHDDVYNTVFPYLRVNSVNMFGFKRFGMRG